MSGSQTGTKLEGLLLATNEGWGTQMTARKHSANELRKASDHVWYEMWMFQSLVAGMGSGIAGQGVINNALLESFAIHLRGLIHFFYAGNPQSDDVVAQDFFEDPETWRSGRPLKNEILQVAKKRADKEVAHLTYSRIDITPEDKLWDFVQLHEELQKAISAFIKDVPRELLGESWKETVERFDAGSESA